ncbi:MAG TPA: undecaprenyl-phosphate glucose phosphotransferase [Rhodothermales bacterium]|nr:undecaprenyl-phosphate glucose phosphotransferase [Rhodothermales bacterium]
MFNERSKLFQRALFVADLGLIAAGWIIAYYIRFELLVPIVGLPLWRPLSRYISYLPPLIVIWGVVFLASGLYSSDRAQRLPLLVYGVLRAVSLGMAASVAGLFFYRAFSFSRLHMLLFGIVTTGLMVVLRIVLYSLIRQARKHGRNFRRVLIVGAGKVGRRLADAFRQYPLMGYDVVGFLDDQKTGPDILGRTSDLSEVMDRLDAEDRPIDSVYIALPVQALSKVQEMTEVLSTRLASVCLVPDILQFNLLNSRISEVDGLPVIHLADEPPIAFGRVVKRGIDIVFSASVLLLLSPLYLLIMLGVRLTSPGPILYRQVRMGLNGHQFEILKFRSMPVDVEEKSGPVWAKQGEVRATPFGSFLRKTSLDELPQFINVLKGDMSVVGPRPERPHFIEDFKNRVPRYMLRHKMKAGITGWAQVHGLRGNTSIEKRIEYDLYYIQNWSLGLDLRIMALTLWRGFVSKNAY